jgi:hypothetical protein
MFFDIKILHINKIISFKAKSTINYSLIKAKNLIIDTLLNENNNYIKRNFIVKHSNFKIKKIKKENVFYYKAIIEIS